MGKLARDDKIRVVGGARHDVCNGKAKDKNQAETTASLRHISNGVMAPCIRNPSTRSR
jgi:hypothetical protein